MEINGREIDKFLRDRRLVLEGKSALHLRNGELPRTSKDCAYQFLTFWIDGMLLRL